jgi:hypothetical protein
LDHLLVINPRVRENPGAEKELFLRFRSEPVDSEAAFLEGIRSDRLDLEGTVYLNGEGEALTLAPAREPLAFPPEVELIARKTDEIAAEVTLPAPAWVIFSELWYFPWRAKVDGKPVHLYRAYNVLQAVRVPAGLHRVHFYFNSRHWRLVLPVIFSSALAMALAGCALYWGRRARCPPAPRLRKERRA